jgi:hypothetical protein
MTKQRTLVSIAVTFLDDVAGGQSLATPEARAACQGDAFKFRREILTSTSMAEVEERAGTCMKRNREKLSPACQKFVPEE